MIDLQPGQPVPADGVIAQRVQLAPIQRIAADLGLLSQECELFGEFKAKIKLSVRDRLKDAPSGNYGA